VNGLSISLGRCREPVADHGLAGSTGAGDISGDGKADLIFQSTSNDVAAWVLDGLTVSSAAVIGNSGAGWVLGDIGDFNADGFSDVAFQNSGSSDIAIWELNNTTIIAAGVVGATGAGWELIA